MNKKMAGFSLIELMIVVAIIGILAGVGYPAYTNSIKKADRADGIDGLLSLAGRMEEFYISNDTYAGATITAGGDGTIGSNKTGEDKYTLSITSQTAYAYSLTATPKKADDECGNLIINSLGVKSDSKANGGCW